MKTQKIKFNIKELSGTAKSFQNGITRMSFKLKINDNRMKTPYSCPVLINHERITKQILIADIISHCIESTGYYSNYNHFQDPSDYQNFADDFGYEKINETMNVVNELRRFNRLLNSLELTQKDKEILEYYRDDEDGALKNITALIKRHFDVLFISDYINK